MFEAEPLQPDRPKSLKGKTAMTTKTKSSKRPVLKGLSRSAACSKLVNNATTLDKDGVLCGRLAGHHGDHRASLQAAPTKSVKASVKVGRTYSEAEVAKLVAKAVLLALKPSASVPAKAAVKAQRPKVAQCRISRRDIRCSLRLGHKAAGAKHRFGTAVKVLVPAKARRQVAATTKVVKTERFHVSGRPSARLA